MITDAALHAGTSPLSQPWLFQWLRWRRLANGGTQLLGDARVRLVTIVLCTLLITGTLYVGAREGFALLRERNIPGGGLIVGVLFDFLFLTLAVLLVFSGSIILYSSLFASAETAFLLSTPARADQVFAYKFQGAVAFSSWAFVLLGMPILLAFGVTYDVHWGYYALLPVYFLGFLLLPGSFGALGCV